MGNRAIGLRMGKLVTASWGPLWWVGLVAGLLGGCSLMVDPERVQCANTDDCRARGAEFEGTVCSPDNYCVTESCDGDGDCADGECRDGACVSIEAEVGRWACVGDAPSNSSELVQVVMSFVSYFDEAPVADLEFKVCGEFELNCADNYQSTGVTNSDGLAVISVPANFAGYVQVDTGKFLPVQYRFPKPMFHEDFVPAVVLFDLLKFAEQLAATNVSIGLGEGGVMLQIFDCAGVAAGGVAVSTSLSEEDVTIVYALEGLAISQGGLKSTTEGAGTVFLANVDPVNISITLTEFETEQTLTTIATTVQENYLVEMPVVFGIPE